MLMMAGRLRFLLLLIPAVLFPDSSAFTPSRPRTGAGPDKQQPRNLPVVMAGKFAIRRAQPGASSPVRVSPEIAALLSNFGVNPAQHDALIEGLTPLILQQAISSPPGVSEGPVEMEVVVMRSAGGSLGIEVDNSNIIGSNAGQPGLLVGDKILAVDGEALGDKYVGQALAPGTESFVFTVLRGGENSVGSLSRVLTMLLEEAGINDPTGRVCTFLTPTSAAHEKIQEVVQAIELSVSPSLAKQPSEENWYAGLSVDTASMDGYYKLVYTTDDSFTPEKGGDTGLGARPFSSTKAHFQCFQQEDPKCKVVEIIANSNLATHKLGSRTGDYLTDGALVTENFNRLEYAGGLENTKPFANTMVWTVLRDDYRICRSASDSRALRVYQRRTLAEVQAEITAWVEAKVNGMEPVPQGWSYFPQRDYGPSPEPQGSAIQ